MMNAGPEPTPSPAILAPTVSRASVGVPLDPSYSEYPPQPYQTPGAHSIPSATPSSANSIAYPLPAQQHFTPSPAQPVQASRGPTPFQSPPRVSTYPPLQPVRGQSPSSARASLSASASYGSPQIALPVQRSSFQSIHSVLGDSVQISPNLERFSGPAALYQSPSSTQVHSLPSRTSPSTSYRQPSNPIMSIHALSSPIDLKPSAPPMSTSVSGPQLTHESPPSRRISQSPLRSMSPKSRPSGSGPPETYPHNPAPLSRPPSEIIATNKFVDSIMSDNLHPLKRKKERVNGEDADSSDPIEPALDSSVRPPKKRQRHAEPPVWARKAPRAMEPNYRAPYFHGDPGRSNRSKPPPSPPSDLDVPPETPVVTKPEAPIPAEPLGPWEPTITNVAPFRDITRQVADFLFEQVYMRADVNTPDSQPGPKLEIEAKLGRIVDRNTNQRLALPVLSECIIDDRNPTLNIRFESGISDSDFSKMNYFLNQAILDSKQPDANRIPISYTHKKETDTFFQLGPEVLPHIPKSIMQDADLRSPPRLRLTHSMETGELTASIIKVRVKDLHLYSPTSAFDCRISVSMEMEWPIDEAVRRSLQPDPRSRERTKDRLSYQHLAFSIDLTEVSGSQHQKEYELEVEVLSSRVRELANHARHHRSAGYETLVKGFLDNVRVLSRVI